MNYYYMEIIGPNLWMNDDLFLSGSIYNKEKEIVGAIFDSPEPIKETYKNQNFTIIVDEENSNLTGGIRDRISTNSQNAGTLLVVSPKTLQFFKDEGVTNIETFDLKFVCSQFEIVDYKIVHVIGQEDCIDYQQSDLKFRRNGNIKEIHKMIFDEQKISENTKLFAIKGYSKPKIWVRGDLKKAIEKHLSGFYFTHIQDVKDRLN